jgi:hypothetical protein
MPRKKRALTATSAAAEFSAKEAHVLLRKLQELGHVTAAQIHEAREAVSREVADLSERLARLKDAAVQVVSRKPPQQAAERPAWRSGRKQAKAPVSAERQKIMQLQGRYMALGHQIPKSEMNKFREMIKTKGKEATVKAMEGFVAKKGKKK